MSASSSRRRVWIALGAILIVGGLVGAVLLWNGAAQRRTSAIENFARAPIGCDTTLDFIEPGEYLLFVETAGNLDGVRGTCDVEGSYDNSDQDTPDVEIVLVDPDGADIDLDRTSGSTEYDDAGYRGVAVRSVDIEDTDDHVLRAEADVDDVFVVAVGRDPNEGVAALRAGAIAAGVIGLLAGIVLVLLGSRKSSATVPVGWTPGAPHHPGVFVPGGVPQGPPVYGHQSGPPQYGQPTAAPPQPQYGRQPTFGGGQPQYGQAGPPVDGQPQFPQQGVPPQVVPQQPPAVPASPQYPQPAPPVPRQPDIAGQPTFPQAPVDPAGSAQPIEWAPQAPAPQQYPSETAPPDADFLARLREDRSTQERSSPPPPE